MAEKRLTRHELKEDPLVTGAFRAREYLAENREKFLWGLAVLALLVLGGWWFLNDRREKDALAETVLTRANLELQTGQLPLALQDLRLLVEKHSGTPAGKEGFYYLANAYFQIADYEQAEHYYREFIKRSGNSPVIAASAHAGLATCLELKGRTEEAAASFVRAVEGARGNSQTPDYLVGAVRTHAALGDSAKARQFFSRLKKDFPIYREQINQSLLFMGMQGIYEPPQ
ncbi:MAG TPA: tetratricopeptide repeat protein [candidate division Zixibacteria bacterium]|nr:tetratricopeptide repeat protein [candidate division Zixibacteria bacterium]